MRYFSKLDAGFQASSQDLIDDFMEVGLSYSEALEKAEKMTNDSDQKDFDYGDVLGSEPEEYGERY